MNKISCLKNIFKNGGFFILLLIITFYFMFRNQDIGKIISTAAGVRPGYIVIAVGCMCMFVCCEAVNISRTLKIYNYRIPFYKCIKYAMAGFFFSGITPMSTGGQPMQIYYMYKDNIEISHSALALMLELASYQFATVTMAILAFIIKFEFFNSINYQLKYILILGVFLNLFLLVLILLAFFSKGVLEKCINAIMFILGKFHIKRVDEIRRKCMRHLEVYQDGAAAFKENKSLVIKVLITTTIQIIGFHSVPFWIYKAFGLYDYSFITIISLQAVLYITVCAIPLPGAVGASESGFMLIYSTMFPVQIINSAMLLSRGISFYLFLCISGICLISVQIISSLHLKYNRILN